MFKIRRSLIQLLSLPWGHSLQTPVFLSAQIYVQGQIKILTAQNKAIPVTFGTSVRNNLLVSSVHFVDCGKGKTATNTDRYIRTHARANRKNLQNTKSSKREWKCTHFHGKKCHSGRGKTTQCNGRLTSLSHSIEQKRNARTKQGPRSATLQLFVACLLLLRWNFLASLRSSFAAAGAKFPHPLPFDKFSEARLVLLHHGSEGFNLLGPKLMGQSVRCLRFFVRTTLTPRGERTPSSQKTFEAKALAIF